MWISFCLKLFGDAKVLFTTIYTYVENSDGDLFFCNLHVRMSVQRFLSKILVTFIKEKDKESVP